MDQMGVLHVYRELLLVQKYCTFHKICYCQEVERHAGRVALRLGHTTALFPTFGELLPFPPGHIPSFPSLGPRLGHVQREDPS